MFGLLRDNAKPKLIQHLCMHFCMWSGPCHLCAWGGGGGDSIGGARPGGIFLPPEKGKGVNELAEQCGQSWLGREDWALNSQPVRAPKAALSPVCQWPGYIELLEQSEDVMVLQPQHMSACSLNWWPCCAKYGGCIKSKEAAWTSTHGQIAQVVMQH